MTSEIRLLDVVALTVDKLDLNLVRGEIGTVVECYPDDAYEVEFVAQDGFTYALATFRSQELIPLREKREISDPVAVSAGS